MALSAYHHAWLSKHPERDAPWLEAKLREGFDVHHLDADHGNNDPSNLVLIETGDHMGLHGMSMKRLLISGRQAKAKKREAEKRSSKRFALGKQAYEMKTPLLTWGYIGRRLKAHGELLPDAQVKAAAERYAQITGLPWPIPGTLPREALNGMRCRDGVWSKMYGPWKPAWLAVAAE
ncbi:hypothetical protein [Methylobacterium sp. 1973]|uniref:hypothetical protein n=1 Tax=Methylobacterium sp. 1973 TaxID=3156421 RepID=UPI00339915D8